MLESGIYIPKLVGSRYSDTVLKTSGDHEVLTKTPKALAY
jgi:Xaa-Pro aminopeptidase